VAFERIPDKTVLRRHSLTPLIRSCRGIEYGWLCASLMLLAAMATAASADELPNPGISLVPSSTLVSATVNVPYTTTLNATGGTAPYIYSSAVLPAGLGMNSAGLITGTPTLVDPVGTGFSVTVSDGSNPVKTATVSLTLKVLPQPLTITTTTLPPGVQGAPYSQPIQAVGGAPPYSWSLFSGSLDGLQLDTGSGNVHGSPTSAGPFSFKVKVTDSSQPQSQAVQTITFQIAYAPLSITPAPIEIAVGGSVSATLAATGGLPPYTWMAAGTPPQGFALTSSGLLTGTSSQVGTIAISAQVKDSQPQPYTASATINVGVFGLTTTSPLTPGTTTSAYSAAFNAGGGTTPYIFSATGLPAGLSLSTSGNLTGTVKLAGTYSFSVHVTDRVSITVSSTYSLTIDGPAPLAIVAPSLANGMVNVPYSASLSSSASGGTPPYQWAIEAGALPPGLSLSSTGVISGTPTTAGSYSFTVEATDGSGATASTSATLLINPPTLTITTQSPLTSGIVNVDYPLQVLTATGGVPPYTFSITGGSLPNGMSLTNGAISGTPTPTPTSTVVGGFSVTVTVRDNVDTQTQATLVGTIRPPSTDLVLSTETLSFALSSGGAALPAAQNVSISSSDVNQRLPFTIQVTPASAWLTVSGGSTTPTALVVSLTSQALNLAPSPTPYATAITVTCNVSTPCANETQTVNVSLLVAPAPAVLKAVTDLLSFSATSSPPAASTQSLTVENTGGGALTFGSVNCEASWCTVGSIPTFLSGGSSIPINITADPTGLAAGYYRTTVDITSSAGFASIPITLLVAQSEELLLAPAGAQIPMLVGGSPGNPNGSFLVSVAGSATVNWTASITSTNTSWLILNSTSGTASGSAPGTVSFSIDPTMTAGLAAQPYYANIQVTAPGAINSPQNFEVILNVSPASTPLFPDPEPTGLVFLTQANAAPPTQTVQVFATSAMASAYQASATTNDGAPWLGVSPTTGNTSATPARSEVAVDPSSLSPGIYYAQVSYSFSPAAVRTVSVTLIVQPPITGSGGARPSADSVHPNTTAAPTCTPSILAPAQAGLVDNFSTPASWPTPLSILLMDDCGNAVANGQIVATFTNGDPPLALALANSTTGLYSGTWTPRKTSSQVSLNARATAPGFATANLRIAGQVIPNMAPVLNKDGTLNGFNPQQGAALAPGTIVQIFGAGLASATVQSTNVPLPTSLNGTQIIIGGIPAPLFYVSPSQVNAQIPSQLSPNNQYQLIASANGALTTPITVQLAPVTPGFAVNADGSLIAQHGDGTLVTAASPAQPGEEVVAYLSGLGDTTTPISAGDVAPSDPPAAAAVTPVVTLNGTPATVLFAGLTPTLVGLYQVNFQIPPGTPNGLALVVLTQGTFTSNSAILPVQAPPPPPAQ